MENKMLTLDEVHKLPGFREYSKRTIRRWAHDCGLPHYKIEEGNELRFFRVEVMSWFESKHSTAKR